MITQLTPEQQEATQRHGASPLPIVDPATNRRYVLMSQDQYERLKALWESGPLTDLEQRQLLQDAGRRAGWDDPAMDAYDSYDEYKRET
jgi:hypothetical protein